MDGLVEQIARHVELVQTVHQQVHVLHDHDVHEHGHDPLGVHGAARNVDDRRGDADLLQVLLDAKGLGRVGGSGHPAAVHGAGADRHNGVGRLGSLHKGRDAGLAGHAQSVAVEGLEHGALVDENVVACRDGLGLGLLHGVASGGRQGLRVVQGDHVEHDRCDIGSLHLGEGLRATGAGSTLDPDDRIQVAGRRADNRLFQSLRHARNRELGEPGCGGDAGAQLHEAATGNATRGKDAVKV